MPVRKQRAGSLRQRGLKTAETVPRLCPAASSKRKRCTGCSFLPIIACVP
jgi:hypothetical protein